MKWFLSLFILLCTYSLNAADIAPIKVYQQHPFFEVRLKANPTTGYTWTLVYFDKKLVQLTSSVYQGAKTQLIGAGGEMLYTFKVNRKAVYPATTELVFKYGRPWEKNASERRIKVNLVP